MGRKHLGKVTQNFRISPEFQAFCRREARDAGKTLGDWLEDYFSEKTIETASDTGEAIREVSLALQAWIINPADLDARRAFESALARCLIERG